MPRLKSTNFAVTQLAANMTATDKTFTVTDASKFPNRFCRVMLPQYRKLWVLL